MANKYRVTVNGEVFEVQIEELVGGFTPTASSLSPVSLAAAGPLTPQQAGRPAQPKVRENGDGLCIVTSPIPGKILSIRASEGKRIQKGELLLVVEAMKMENEIFAPESGSVSKIYFPPGSNVETGQRLMDIQVGG